MKNSKTNIALAWVLALGTSSIATSATAQAVDPSTDKLVYDEVVVTGERIERSLLETASSVSIVTGADIEERNLESLTDILNQVANVTSNSDGRGFRIRGVSNQSVTGAGNGGLATIYVDGAPLSEFATSFASRDTWDIGQVEVFRGAQSSNQGRDSLAGAIILRSNDPVYEHEYKGRVRVEEFGGTTFSAVANVPVVQDQLALRIGFDRKRSDGFITNTTFNIDDYQASDSLLVRGKLLFEPAGLPGFSNIITVAYSKNDDGGNLVEGPDVFARENTANILDATTLKQTIATWEADYHINDQWGFSNVLSFSTARFSRVLDDDRTSAGGVNARNQTNDIDTLTEEIRLFYTGASLNATGGFYYAEEKEDNILFVLTGLDVGALIGNPALNAVYDLPFLITGDFSNRDRTTNYAAFFNADYDMSDFITLNVGLRYDSESQNLVGNLIGGLESPLPNPALFGPLGPTIAAINAGLLTFAGDNIELVDESYNAWLPSAGVVLHWSDDFTTTLQAKRAYRAGGGGTSVLLGPFSFNPEFAWTYEAGFRKKFMGGKAMISSNVYFTDWTDMQVTIQVPFGNGDFTVANAATAELKGVEVELSARPNDAWNIFANVGYAKTEFVDFQTTDGFGAPVDFSGNEFRLASNWTAAAGASWNSGRGLFAQADINYESEAPSNTANTLFSDSRVLVNAKLGYEWKNITASVYARNVFDTEYVDQDFSDIFAANIARIGNPRVLGVELKFSH